MNIFIRKVILEILENGYTEKMLNNPLTTKYIDGIGGESEREYYLSKLANPKNYKDEIYYKVIGLISHGYAGVGNGLYMGKDKQALIDFYGIDSGKIKIQEYKGSPKWLDLTDYDDFDKFEKMLKDKNIKMLNSDDVGKYVKSIGYDGIVYFDPQATGEEYVLYDTSKVKKINEYNL
jgi:hypothetical protein